MPVILKIHGDDIGEVNFSSHVVGTTFVKNSDRLLRFLRDNVPPSEIRLNLVREPDNESDPNAVMVNVSVRGSSKSKKIGYIPKDRAAILSYALLNPSDYKVIVHDIHIFGGDSDKPNIGLFFDYNIFKIASQSLR